LELVHLLGDFQSTLPIVKSFVLKLVSEVGDFVQHQLLLQQLLFLAIQPFLQNTDLRVECLFIGIFPSEVTPPVLIVGVLQLRRQLALPGGFLLDELLNLDDLLRQLGHYENLIASDLYLALCLCDLDVDHAYVILERLNR